MTGQEYLYVCVCMCVYGAAQRDGVWSYPTDIPHHGTLCWYGSGVLMIIIY